MTKILCGDIGGTKSLLAITDERGRVLVERLYDSRLYPDFAQLVRAFLVEVGDVPTRACFAIAGPVANDRSRATNLPWILDARALEAELGIAKVKLVNDFYAQALAVLELSPDDVVELHPGTVVGGGPVAILGAGTGLGEAFLIHDGGRYEVVPSEGGHADFAPRGERQIDLLRYLREQLGGHVSYERVLSGAGIVSIYSFLRDRRYVRERAAVREAMQREDPAAVISRYALLPEEQRDAMCDTTMELFCEIYGQEAGNLALKVLATGGIYVCGGVAAKNLPRLRDGTFQRAFEDMGRLSAIVKGIPVRCVTNLRSGLIGAAIAALRA